MPDKNEVDDGRLLRPTPLLPDKLTQRATKEELEAILAGPPEGEPNFGEIWMRMGQNRRAEWFRYLLHTDPAVNYLVHKLMDEGEGALGGPNAMQLPVDDAGVDGIRDGARFRVRCRCGKRISVFMHGEADATGDWQRQRVECPECFTLYEFERKAV